MVLDRLVSTLSRVDRWARRHWLPALLLEFVSARLVARRTTRDDSDVSETESREPVADAPAPGSAPAVSVLMPAWNEARHVRRAIEGFLSVAPSNAELVVCAGGTDGTYASASAVADDPVTVIEQSGEMNKQAALNACLDAASGEVFYLVDGDCVLDARTWNATLGPVCNGREHVVTGASRPHDELWGRWLPTYQYVKEEFERARRPRYVTGILGRNVALSSEAMRSIGSFDETVQAGTDYNLAKRLLHDGYRIRFASDSRIQSEYPTTVSGYLAQQSRWLRNVVLLGREWGAGAEVRANATTCAVGTAMLAAPLVGVFFFPVLLGWAGLLAYGIGTRYEWVRKFDRTHERAVSVRWFCPVSAVAMFVEFCAWSYATVELLLPERRRKW